MKIFEIHITGTYSILKELKQLKIKTIQICLLTPNLKKFRNEYMSSFIVKYNTYEECKEYVDSIVLKLKSKIIRVKIECPVYEEYIDRSVYIESHFSPHIEGGKAFVPISQNINSKKLMGTCREYNKLKYNEFIEFWKHNEELELCLYDDYIREDFDWFELYK